MTAHLHPEPVGPGVWRLPLPSRTPPPFDHTNTYLVGNETETVLVDAGSDDPAVLDALETILSTLNLARPQALLLTHTHSDHRTGAAALRERYGLEVYAHPLELPRLEIPARALEDGATLTVGTQTVNVHHTPGHSPGHLSFALPSARTLLVGDLLTAEGSSFVGLPDGDVAAYLASLERLESLTVTLGTGSHTVTLGPGHGPLVRNPGARLQEVRAHRLAREAEVAATQQQAVTEDKLRTADAVDPQVDTSSTDYAPGHSTGVSTDTADGSARHRADDGETPRA